MLSSDLGPAGGYITQGEETWGVTEGPKVVLLAADHDTQSALAAWAQAAGFDLSKRFGGGEIEPDLFDFHITLLASANEVAIPETDHLIEPVEVTPEGFDVLGRDADTPVLRLNPDGLADLRAFFVETYGAEPTFADFKPHISLSYAWDGEPVLEDLEMPDFPLVFDRLIVKPFEPQQKSLAQVIAELEGKADEDDDYEERRGFVLRNLELAAQRITAIEETVDDLRRREFPMPEEVGFRVLTGIELTAVELAANATLLDEMRAVVPPHDGELVGNIEELQRRMTAVMLDLSQAAEEITHYLGPTGHAHDLPETSKFVYGANP